LSKLYRRFWGFATVETPESPSLSGAWRARTASAQRRGAIGV
jgi:hypothetical protein